MGLFSRKEEVPEIPPMPSLPEISPKGNKKSSELPSIPRGNGANDNLNNEMIKSALSDNSFQDIETFNEEEDIKEKEIQQPPSSLKDNSGLIQKKETIFVKIDKFNKSKESLIDIHERIKDISHEIMRLREIKTQEIKELETWDDELKKINLRLSKVDSNIFGEV